MSNDYYAPSKFYSIDDLSKSIKYGISSGAIQDKEVFGHINTQLILAKRVIIDEYTSAAVAFIQALENTRNTYSGLVNPSGTKELMSVYTEHGIVYNLGSIALNDNYVALSEGLEFNNNSYWGAYQYVDKNIR